MPPTATTASVISKAMVERMPKPDDQRRAVRIPAQLFVRVLGVDRVAHLREGNVSVSGIYFATDEASGDVGAVERLEIRTADGDKTLVTTAVCVRVARVKDLWSGERIEGVAFQFLPEDDGVRQDIKRLVEALIDERLDSPAGVVQTDRTPAELSSGAGFSGRVSIGGVSAAGLTLFTEWPVEVGASVSLTIDEGRGGEPIEVAGRVDRKTVLTPGAQFRLDVTLSQKAGLSTPRPVSEGVRDLLGALVAPPVSLRGVHRDQALVGDLSRVPLSSVFSFIEWESFSGTLSLAHADDRAEVYLREGRPVDVDTSWTTRDGRLALTALLAWTEGRFSLAVGDGEREDSLDLTFRELLMEHAKDADESSELAH